MVGLSISIGNDITGRRIGQPNVFADASLAFSLRDLGSGNITHPVLVRRDSDNAEQAFTYSEITDGTLTTWVGLGNDGVVVDIRNQGSLPNSLGVNILNAQPKIVENGNLVTSFGKPTIKFDGNDDYLSANLTDSAFSVMCVIYEPVNINVLLGLSGATFLETNRYFTVDANVSFNSNPGYVIVDNVNYRVIKNGTIINSVNPFTQTFNRFFVGSLNGNSAFYQGKISEILVWDDANDVTSRIPQIQDNINNYFNNFL